MGLCGALQFAAGREQIVAAGEAADADVRAEPLDAPFHAAARMRLAEREPLAEVELYGHWNTLTLTLSQREKGLCDSWLWPWLTYPVQLGVMALRSRSASVRAASAKSAPFDA